MNGASEGTGRTHPCARHDGLGVVLASGGAAGRVTAGETSFGRSGGISRRRFLGQTAAGIAGLIGAPSLPLPRHGRGGSRASKIVRAYHPEATTGWTTVNQEPADMMVQAAIRELTGIGDTAVAWKSLFPGVDAAKTIGIKINLSCGDVPTHPEAVNAIIDGLLMMDLDGEQLPENHIFVWDLDNIG